MTLLARLSQVVCCASHKSDAADKDARIRRLEQQIVEMKGQCTKAEDKVEAKEREFAERDAQHLQNKELLSHSQDLIAENTRRLDKIRQNLEEESAQRLEALQAKFDELTGVNATGSGELEAKSQEAADLQAKLEEARLEIAGCMQSKETEKKAREAIAKQCEDLQKVHDGEKMKSSFERRAFAREIEEERTKVKQQQAEVARHETEHQESLEKLAQVIDRLKEEKAEHEQSKQREVELTETAEQSQRRVSELLAENGQLKNQLSVTWKQITLQTQTLEEERKIWMEELRQVKSSVGTARRLEFGTNDSLQSTNGAAQAGQKSLGGA